MVPVIVEDIKLHPTFAFTRCLYFTIESEDPSPGWALTLAQNSPVPFLMLGLSGVIHAPSPSESEFTQPDQLDTLIAAIEADDRFYVSLADIWLPNLLLANNREPRRNDVFRLDAKLFSEAYRYRRGLLATARFVAVSADRLQAIRFSAIETKVMSVWTRRQFNEAAEAYPKNRELALPWVDENGEGRGENTL